MERRGAWLQQVVPEARIVMAHGQMSAKPLEAVMLKFFHREADVLVDSAIIQSGIDVPNANTIIVNRADTFGLAQLYQLRGRVGRSGDQAYAYFLVPDEGRLTDDAQKRLTAIQQFTELGSGFRIAADQAHEHIYGYACGLDMTRRDLQLVARDKGRPWDLGKDVEQSSVVSEVVAMPGTVLDRGALELRVNGEVHQHSDLSKLIWNIPELIADLSLFYRLQPGDLIFTGTPEGVGPLKAGDRIEGRVADVGTIAVEVGAPE